MSKSFKGSMMLLAASFIWGTSFVAQSEGMNYVEPFTYNAARSLLGGAVLIPIIFIFGAFAKKQGTVSRYSMKNTVIGGVCCGMIMFAASSFQQAGVARTTAGKAGFITALYIVIVPLLGIFLGRRVRPVMWLFVAIAVAGFRLLCINEGFSVSAGDLLVLGCSLFFAVHIMVIDSFNGKNTNGMIISCIQFFTSGILSAVCMFIFEEPKISGIIGAGGTILYTGIMSSGVAYTLQILGQKRTEPAAATLLMSLESVFAALSGWLLLNERLTPKELCGCGLVFAAVVLAQFFGTAKEKNST